ncbi:hypothetical protein CANINC_004370 [Pichia inconspicua]|uniref:SHSP domain-containing protein n=1 Tax=Pichia inconspicua TaxID=52247 RepID=A0A4T0WW88_9ASCO|nr:hypothetical protein CANINC_004370 [[Candida] inconspicua]
MCPSETEQLNEFCLLDKLQRGYAYRQHQILKRQIQKLNQPVVEFTRDVNSYYVVVTKEVNQMNYQVMNRFNNYDLRQVENTLIIKSTRDNFFKQITLPQNVDLTKDITYKLTDNGFGMIICIPKEQNKYQRKTLFGLPESIDEIFGDRLSIKNKVIEKRRLAEGSDKPLKSSIKIPIVYDTKLEEAKVQTHQEPQSTVTSNSSHYKNEDDLRPVSADDTAEFIEQDLEPLTGLTDDFKNHIEIIQKGCGEKCSLQNTPKMVDTTCESTIELPDVTIQSFMEHDVFNPLKNYETTKRKTVFEPNTVVSDNIDDQNSRVANTDSGCQNDTEYIPVRRILSPTLEDVVDQEFM